MTNIKFLRKQKGMTVLELANYLGISQSFMTRIENGQRELSLDLAIKIANYLDCLVTDLVDKSYDDQTLEDMRTHIDEIDMQMAILFNKRMNVIKQISHYKKIHNMATLDKKREKQIYNNNILIVLDEFKPYYDSLLGTVLAISKDYQKKHL